MVTFQRKGQLSAAWVVVVALLAMMAITMGIVGDVLDDKRTSDVDSKATTRVSNETVTWVNGTVTALARSPGAAKLTCVRVLTNSSPPNNNGGDNSSVVNSGNWSCDASGINVTSAAIPAFFNLSRTVNVTYDFVPADENINITTNSLEGELSLGDQLGSVGTVLAVVVVIATLAGTYMMFMR